MMERGRAMMAADDGALKGDSGVETARGDDIERLLSWGPSRPVWKYIVWAVVAVFLIMVAVCYWLWPAKYRVRFDAPENVGYLGPTIQSLTDKLEEPCGFEQQLPFWPRRCARIEFEDEAIRT